MIWRLFYNKGIWHVALWDWHAFHSELLSENSPRLMCVSIIHAFSLLSSILWYGRTRIISAILLLKDICVISSFQLLPIRLLQTSMHRFLYEHKFPVLWYKCQWVQSLDCIRAVGFLFKKNCQTPSSVASSFTFPLQCMRDPVSPHPGQNFVLPLFF